MNLIEHFLTIFALSTRQKKDYFESINNEWKRNEQSNIKYLHSNENEHPLFDYKNDWDKCESFSNKGKSIFYTITFKIEGNNNDIKRKVDKYKI